MSPLHFGEDAVLAFPGTQIASRHAAYASAPLRIYPLAQPRDGGNGNAAVSHLI